VQWKSLVGAIVMALSAVVAAPTVAAPAQTAQVPVDWCQALDGRDFSRTRDAPFTITAAKTTTENVPQPYCKVTGYVIPEISFEMRLPLAGWNHGFVLVGSGGWASNKFTFLCRGPLAKGYACIAGDGGHQFNDGLWMQSNAQAKIDWGYRATHVVALAGKALVEAFYGALPNISLMLGGSTGGYQGLVEAQRFPWDFNGIVAVAPDIDEGDLSMRTAWAARHLIGGDGQPIFTKDDLAVLHAGALRACDLSDGLRDGIIGDPLTCRFDPRSVQCKSDGAGQCLSPRQVAAAAAIYGGPTTSKGQPISTGGPFPGSEMGWYDILEDVKFAEKFFRFALAESPLDGFPASEFDYDEDYKRLGLAGTFVSSNPDLRKFAQAGGKLLIVQGSNDVTKQSRAAIDYFQMVERVMGGAAATRDFARLFLIPGMDHVTGGDGAGAIDYLAAIEAWVSRKTAPELLVGAHVPDWNDRSFVEAGLTGPTPNMKVTFTRPAYPFPLHARYKGHGDVSDARNFAPAAR
jgi:pimeloyl-ACP methyl ester carboxylesterase